MHSLLAGLLICVALTLHSASAQGPEQNPRKYGTFISQFLLRNGTNNIQGTVYAISDSIFFIRNFSYSGQAMDTYFWVGTENVPGPKGTMVVYPQTDSNTEVALGRYENEDIILRLPNNMKIYNLNYLSIWCSRITMNFAHIDISKNLIYPKIQVLPEFTRKAHGLRSGHIVILDSKTIYIPNLHYDGRAPAAYFWVGTGSEPDVRGKMIPNQINETTPLKAYSGEDIELVLPGDLTVYDIDYLGVWCVKFGISFGEVLIPKDIYVPPALGQTKIATSSTPAPDFSNCIELIQRRVQVEWEPLGDDVQIRVSARIRDDQYVAFGIDGENGATADVVVVGYNKDSKKFFAEDYYASTAHCNAERVCPDHKIGGKNDAIFITGKRKNGVTSVTYKRPFKTNDSQYDKIIPDAETPIIAIIGTLNNNYEANAPSDSDVLGEVIQIYFKGKGNHQCTSPLTNLPYKPKLKAWPSMKISGVNNFTVRIGPSGGDRGYSGITGLPSWSSAWYINEMLIPEITVEKGKKYTFYVEGGDDKNNIARYHPFYITDSPLGGLGQRTPNDLRRERVFAGVAFNSDNPYPTATGRECTYVHKGTDQSGKAETFKEFFGTLKLECKEGEPGILEWLVEKDTPDVVYYQSYEHENLGWKIIVNSAHTNRAIAPFVIIVFALILTHLR